MSGSATSVSRCSTDLFSGFFAATRVPGRGGAGQNDTTMIRNWMFGALALLGGGCGAPGGGADDRAPRKEIAVQLYSVRSLTQPGGAYEHDWPRLLGRLGEMGYTAVEAAGYADGRFYGFAPEEFRRMVEAAGMRPLSSHCTKPLTKEEVRSGDFTESLKWWDACIAAHKAAGMSYVVTPWMDLPETLAELVVYCAYYDEVGRRCREAGLGYGYHNHAHEFRKVEDRVVLDYMLEHTDPGCVFFQLDVYWAVMGQASPVDYFTRYPGRFRLLHIKDRREIGESGMVGFDAIFRHAAQAGAEYMIVEMEKFTSGVEEGLRQSLDYLNRAPFVAASYARP